VATIGALLPGSPIGSALGFAPLPGGFFAALVAMVIGYLVLIEAGKRLFYGTPTRAPGPPQPTRHQRRRAAYFSANVTGRSTRVTGERRGRRTRTNLG
jgi:P-type Mg2+ transporter